MFLSPKTTRVSKFPLFRRGLIYHFDSQLQAEVRLFFLLPRHFQTQGVISLTLDEEKLKHRLLFSY